MKGVQYLKEEQENWRQGNKGVTEKEYLCMLLPKCPPKVSSALFPLGAPALHYDLTWFQPWPTHRQLLSNPDCFRFTGCERG